MTKPWTNLSLKAVFEYVEANKRLNIISHCPTLRPIEKEAPLYLDYLSFRKNEIRINTKSIHSKSYKTKAGMDISAVERLKSFLRERKTIQTKELEVLDLGCIPKNLNIYADSVNSGDLNFAQVLSFLDTSSFPLKFLRTNISNTPAYFAYANIAKKLVILVGEMDRGTSERITDVLFNPRNQNIVFENFHLEAEGMAGLIQSWQENKYEIGRVFTTNNANRVSNSSDFVEEILARSNGRKLQIRIKDKHWPRLLYSPCITFPCSTTSELVLYSCKTDIFRDYETKLEVMPIGSTRPATIVAPIMDFLHLSYMFLFVVVMLLFIFGSPVYLLYSALYSAPIKLSEN